MPLRSAWCAAILLAALTQSAHAQEDAAAPGQAPASAGEPESPPAESPSEPAPPEETPAAEQPAEPEPPEEAPSEPPVVEPPVEQPEAPSIEPPAGEVESEVLVDTAAADAPADAAAAAEAEEILVTGSRIKRSSFAASAPVQIIDQQQIAYSGAKNLADVMRYMTANGSSDLLGTGFASAGTSSVNLRGLGTQATLVLINGRRFMPSAGGVATVFYDLNSVPVASVERLEILRGGASSIYGSDAVAGVVNIITKKNWTGLSAQVGGQSTDRLDHAERDASLAVGIQEGKVSMNLGLSYNYRDELGGGERDWTEGTVTTIAGNPGNFILGQINPDPDCEHELSSATKLNLEGWGRRTEPYCEWDFGGQSTLFGEREMLSLYGYSEYEISDHTAIFNEVGYTRMRQQQTATPSLPVLPETLVPADHIDNPFGDEVGFIGQILPAERGPQKISFGDDTVRVVLGLKGDLGDVALGSFAEDWEWEVAGSWSSSRYNGWLPIETIHANLVEALNSCNDRSDLSMCFNPFFTAYTGEGTPNSQEVIDWIRGRLIWSTESKLTTADVGLTGPLLELPGGDLAFAIGAQYRLEERLTQGDHDAEQQNYSFFYGFTSAEARKDIVSAYIELLWPLFSGLEVQTAGRIEDHENSGTNASPSVGVLVTPVLLGGGAVEDGAFDRLQLRAHATRAFRSPSLYQTFPGFATSVGTFTDDGLDVMRPIQFFGNPDAQPEVATALSFGFDWSPVQELGMSIDYFRYMYDDRVIGESALQIYMNDPNDPRVQRNEAGDLTGVEVMVINADEVNTHGIDFMAMLKFELGTKDTTLAFGTDGTLIFSYEIPSEWIIPIRVTGGGEARAAECDEDTCDIAGVRNSANFADPLPRLRLNAPLIFESGGHAISFIAHFISGLTDDQNADEDAGTFPDIDSFTTFDFQYAYTADQWLGMATTLRIGVINILDSDPPVVQTPWGYLSGVHDPRGRMIYARLEQEF